VIGEDDAAQDLGLEAIVGADAHRDFAGIPVANDVHGGILSSSATDPRRTARRIAHARRGRRLLAHGQKMP
jgi:hypothetical protein